MTQLIHNDSLHLLMIVLDEGEKANIDAAILDLRLAQTVSVPLTMST